MFTTRGNAILPLRVVSTWWIRLLLLFLCVEFEAATYGCETQK